MNPIMSDLRAANAIRAHKDQSLITRERPSRATSPKMDSLLAIQPVRGRMVTLFSSIGKRFQHGHVSP